MPRNVTNAFIKRNLCSAVSRNYSDITSHNISCRHHLKISWIISIPIILYSGFGRNIFLKKYELSKKKKNKSSTWNSKNVFFTLITEFQQGSRKASFLSDYDTGIGEKFTIFYSISKTKFLWINIIRQFNNSRLTATNLPLAG